jgi:pimeloyl-ACP methyl ester carboxylesterase
MDKLTTSWGDTAFERRNGDAPTLVFLHGTGCDSADWRGVLNHLSSDIATLAIDFRGHGESAVPDEDFEFNDLAADVGLTLEILNVERPIIVGHSLGGMVGIDLLTKYPLAGLVLLEGWTRLSVVMEAYEKGPRLERMHPDRVQEIESKRDTTLSRFGGDQWRAFWHTVREFDGSAALESTDVPVFEVYGTLGAKPDAQSKLCIPDRPNIRVEWIEGCGHYLPHEMPEHVAQVCQRVHEACR